MSSLLDFKKNIVFRSNKSILVNIILLGLLLRLINLSSPILDLYPIRQEYCAMVARNFFKFGLNIFNPQVDWVGNLNSYWSAELPLISFISACFYRIFGIHEFIGRLVAIFFSVSSIYFFYKFVRSYLDENTSLFSAFCFAVIPMNVYFGRTFMPESAMICFSLLALYLFSLWLKVDKLSYFLLATLVTSIAFLVKITAFFIFLPILFIFYQKFNKGLFLNWKIWFFLIITLLPTFYWYERTNIEMSSYLLDMGNLRYLINPDFYKRLFESISLLVLTPLGLILFPLGFFAKIKDRSEYIFYVLFISVGGYICVYPKINFVHYYYQLPIALPCSVFMGRALGIIFDDRIKKSILPNFLTSKKFACIFLTLLVILSLITIKPMYKWNKYTYKAACLINEHTRKDSIIIEGRCSQEAPLYYCNRKGWVINEYGFLSYVYWWHHKDFDLRNFPVLDEITLVKYLIQNGADYYLNTNIEAFNANPELVKFLRSNYPVWAETDKYIIFKLN